MVERASWRVRGALTWELVEGGGACASVATARLSEAWIEEGARSIPLPDLSFRNELFGCFAG